MGTLRSRTGHEHHIFARQLDIRGEDGAFFAHWQPLKLYYFVGFPPERFDALAQTLAAHGMENPFEEWAARVKDMERRRWEITTRVHCSEYFEVANDALRAHATQIDPDGGWFRFSGAIPARFCHPGGAGP